MINIINKLKENKSLSDITNIIITILITIVTCIMPLIAKLNKNPNVYYIIGVCLIILLIIKRKELKFDKTDKVLLIYFLLACLSTIFSIYVKASIIGTWGRFEGILMIAVYVLLYYSAKNFFKYYSAYFKILFFVATIIAIYSVCQYYDFMPIHKFFDIYYLDYYPSGTMGNPNFLGSFITIFLPITMAIYLITNKKFFMVSSLILFASLICTLTRSAWLAFGIYSLIGAVFVFKSKKKEYFIRTGILLLCFIIIFVGINLIDTNNRLAKRSSDSIKEATEIVTEGINEDMGSSRIFIWRLCLENVFKYPLFGCGVDCVNHVIRKEQPLELLRYMETYNAYIDKAHNEYLQIAVTMGIPALVCYLTFIALILKDKIKNIFKSKISFIFVISIIGYLVQAFFNISVIQVAPLFWILLGVSDNTNFINSLKEKHNFLTK